MTVCQFIGTVPSWLNPIGLCLDFVGVVLLGIDLVRVQRSMKRQAREDLRRFDAMVEDHGGTEEWITSINKGIRWIDQHEYWDHHAEDEVSYNVTNLIEQLKELVQAISGIAEASTKLIKFQHEQSRENARIADASIRYSFIGLMLICLGFALQFVSATHQICGP
ncbi:hypothetical protein [Bradyrhizobium sp. OK095]|uniref:hypothetical protein n=1 Tax=Bradyrhizobium sp. OK095 TaxID=1882760 RepID=UPI000B89224A|nr:hypothetical protein [Bradyrhizobium sp. OK095]